MFICKQCEVIAKDQGGVIEGINHAFGPCDVCGRSLTCLDARVYQFNQPRLLEELARKHPISSFLKP